MGCASGAGVPAAHSCPHPLSRGSEQHISSKVSYMPFPTTPPVTTDWSYSSRAAPAAGAAQIFPSKAVRLPGGSSRWARRWMMPAGGSFWKKRACAPKAAASRCLFRSQTRPRGHTARRFLTRVRSAIAQAAMMPQPPNGGKLVENRSRLRHAKMVADAERVLRRNRQLGTANG